TAPASPPNGCGTCWNRCAGASPARPACCNGWPRCRTAWARCMTASCWRLASATPRRRSPIWARCSRACAERRGGPCIRHGTCRGRPTGARCGGMPPPCCGASARGPDATLRPSRAHELCISGAVEFHISVCCPPGRPTRSAIPVHGRPERIRAIHVPSAPRQEVTMKVSEVMTRNPEVIKAGATVMEAAKRLAHKDIGGLPVEQDDRLIGMLTDRDIVVRVVADGRDPEKTTVKDVVSRETKYCYEDEDVSHVASNMDQLLVRRLPVVSRDKRRVGIVSIEDIRPRKH